MTGYRRGIRAAAPIGLAAFAFGASFGVLARAAGMGWLAPVVMSATTFAGSAQFAATSVLDAGGTVVAAIAAAVMLNARYTPIGITVASRFRGGAPRRIIESQLVVDESWAIAMRGGSPDVRTLLGAGAVLWVAWTSGTAAGVLLGDVVGDPERFGLDAAFPALFLALLVPLVRHRSAVLAAVAGALVALCLLPFVPAGIPIVAAGAAAFLGWRR